MKAPQSNPGRTMSTERTPHPSLSGIRSMDVGSRCLSREKAGP